MDRAARAVYQERGPALFDSVIGYATAWLEYQLRGNATAAGAFTGPHPELLANHNWPGSAVK